MSQFGRQIRTATTLVLAAKITEERHAASSRFTETNLRAHQGIFCLSFFAKVATREAHP